MDDLTLLEFIKLLDVGLASHNFKTQVPSNIPQHNQIIRSEHLKTTKYVNEINDWTEKNLKKLNEKKTHQIIFNFNRDKQFTTEVRLKGEPLEIVEEVKLLGVIITNDLRWYKNTSYLVKKANKKMRMLHIAFCHGRNNSADCRAPFPLVFRMASEMKRIVFFRIYQHKQDYQKKLKNFTRTKM